MGVIGAFFRLLPPVGVLSIGGYWLLRPKGAEEFVLGVAICPIAFCWLLVATIVVAKSLRV